MAVRVSCAWRLSAPSRSPATGGTSVNPIGCLAMMWEPAYCRCEAEDRSIGEYTCRYTYVHIIYFNYICIYFYMHMYDVVLLFRSCLRCPMRCPSHVMVVL